jgi:hypothetical protein
MNISSPYPRSTDFSRLITGLAMVTAIASLLLAACAGPSTPNRAEEVRDKLTQLQSDSRLAPLAPDAINEAERAVSAAERPTRDEALSDHLIVMADGKVELARARAEAGAALFGTMDTWIVWNLTGGPNAASDGTNGPASP